MSKRRGEEDEELFLYRQPKVSQEMIRSKREVVKCLFLCFIIITLLIIRIIYKNVYKNYR